ncbi:hypothetical protein [Actinacidiphila guanduensis]|uniref:AAA family ATPase n=1 Tax=Actinacidiphila guanduensis TaxID=310781 RepID=A0A1G9ZEL3_9ACTN|nr:hypothetical protein [Actinacidiphila guanduensis]SDN19567.1 hypothetical protein SAMN05216259_103123 [Actinacidiphila guanduensis]
MDHTEGFGSAPDPDTGSGTEGAPGSGTSPFGASSQGWTGPQTTAFDAFAAGAPGQRGPRHPTGPGEPHEPFGPVPDLDDDSLGLTAGAGAIARLSGAESFDAFGPAAAADGDAAPHEEDPDRYDSGELTVFGAASQEEGGPDAADEGEDDGEDVNVFGVGLAEPAAEGPGQELVPYISGGREVETLSGAAGGGGAEDAAEVPDDGDDAEESGGSAVDAVFAAFGPAPGGSTPADSSGGPAGSPAEGSFDAFGSGAPSAPAPGGSGGFGVSDAAAGSSFDPFGGPATPESPVASGGFDAPADSPRGFDAFGSAPAAGGSFDAFGTGARGKADPAGTFDAFGTGARNAAGDTGSLPALRRSGTPSLFDGSAPVPGTARPARDPLAPDAGTGHGGGSARVEQVVTAGYLLTINHVDGTEVSPCPPEQEQVPVRRSREERERQVAARRPTPPPGPPGPELPLLEREEDRERLIRLLGRGRSIRVTGPSGAGRTALLESVAHACGDLAPDGVLWLSGYHRTAADLLQDLYTLVYAGERYRPTRTELPGLLRQTGAVVVVDDLEIGGAALEELLAAAPECAFLMAATPDVSPPAAESAVEEVLLSGLSRGACTELLQLAAGRPLEDDEAAWAADLWFESEGLPLRFLQAGALLRQRDAQRRPHTGPDREEGWEHGTPPIPDLSPFDGPAAAPAVPALPPRPRTAPAAPLPASAVPLPPLAESAAPADLLAARLSDSGREALAFAVALDGECPHPSHLPALVGDTHGDAALGELTAVGLAVPVDAHFRLAAGVTEQLAASLNGDGELSDVQAHTAALHYAWWTGHPSVTPERAAAESEAIIAAMTACRDGGHASAAVLLARTVAPAFAAALHWGAWERTLRVGQEAARLSGEVAEEAYFLHELGVLALCQGNADRARAELEASIALRAALADRQGTVVGRRTLALVDDMEGAAGAAGTAPALPAAPAALTEETAVLPQLLELPPATVEALALFPPLDPAPALPEAAPTIVGKPVAAAGSGSSGARRFPVIGSRRTLVAVGTAVVLAAVLGTIVTLGATSHDTPDNNQVKPLESVQQDPPVDDEATSSADATTTSPKSTSGSPSATTTSATPSTPAGTSTAPQGGSITSPPADQSTTPPAHNGDGGPSSHPTTKPGHPTQTTKPPTTPPTTPSTTPSTTPPTTPTETPTG